MQRHCTAFHRRNWKTFTFIFKCKQISSAKPDRFLKYDTVNWDDSWINRYYQFTSGATIRIIFKFRKLIQRHHRTSLQRASMYRRQKSSRSNILVNHVYDANKVIFATRLWSSFFHSSNVTEDDASSGRMRFEKCRAARKTFGVWCGDGAEISKANSFFPAMVLQESDMFMDALTASTKAKEPRKRKRKVSTKDSPNEQKKTEAKDAASTPPTSPSHGEDGALPIVKPELKVRMKSYGRYIGFFISGGPFRWKMGEEWRFGRGSWIWLRKWLQIKEEIKGDEEEEWEILGQGFHIERLEWNWSMRFC